MIRQHLMKPYRVLLCLFCLKSVVGCLSPLPPPANHLAQGKFYMSEREDPDAHRTIHRTAREQDALYYAEHQPYHRYGKSSQEDVPSGSQQPQAFARDALAAVTKDIPLSYGDRVRIHITEGEIFNGDYEVSFDGTLQLPYLTPVPIVGRSIREVEQTLRARLVAEGLFQHHFVQVSVRHLDWGPIQVQVTGAVFQPGQVLLNNRTAEERGQPTQAGGEYAVQRTLTAALQAAGGVRPDADVQRIAILRGDTRWVIDLAGVVYGTPLVDPPLVAGDQVIVESTGLFNKDLVRPSQITPPGIVVFMSNLTVPASNNASSSIGHDTTRLPYGTRLLQASVRANCVGGTNAVNSRRYVVLASHNPITGQSEVIERSVERLIRDARRDEFNPYLLAGDALACYDSVVTNIRDVVRILTDVLLGFTLPGYFLK
jgi:polysaccharide export outer membrane protein